MNTTLLPGWARTLSTTCCQSLSATPSRLNRWSPVLSPAATAGPFGSSSASTGASAGRHGRIPSERIGSGSSAPLSQLSRVNSRATSALEPSSRTVICSEPLSPRRRTNCRLTCDQPLVASPSTETISCPAASPATAARLPLSTSPMTGRTCWLPSMASTQKNTSASRKLAIGPAATIAMRWRTDLRLNDCSTRWAGTSPSRSSSILT
ncbi:hypothetical protein D9M71_469640 [compost metagenome]